MKKILIVSFILLLNKWTCMADMSTWGDLSGGIVDLQVKSIDYTSGQVEYEVFEPCFVRIRFGIFEGPCLCTLENWTERKKDVYQVDFPMEWLRFFDQKSIIAAPLAISFSPDANVIDSIPLSISTGNRYGEAPRVVDIFECAQDTDSQSARDTVPILTLKSSADDMNWDREMAGQYILSIDLNDERRQQFLAERFKLTVYANDLVIYERWDGHLPCTILIDPAVTGYTEGVLIINLYTFFDRLATGYLPFSFSNTVLNEKTSGGKP